MMTLIELQGVLGDRVRVTTDNTLTTDERRRETETSLTVAALAKQMINNADIAIRADRLKSDSKIDGAVIDRYIGDGE